MTTSALGPGTLLGNRYRLGVLLSDVAGARFWRATDVVLGRDVALHVLDADDSRADDVLAAARRAATVVEPHLLRVLDCNTTTVGGGEVALVVNEWGDGISLDHLLGRGKMSPTRAAWLAREVSAAIAHGHDHDVPHGHLNPEAVLVTHSGEVKLIGFAVDAVVHGATRVDPRFGEIGAREADVIDLAGILYAALVGRWPGVTPSAVPNAPYDGKRVLRARQVRAGVPRTLDAVCERVLGKEACEHVMPIETALEVSAVLTDFVGTDADVPDVRSELRASAQATPDAGPSDATSTRLTALTPRLGRIARPAGHRRTAAEASQPVTESAVAATGSSVPVAGPGTPPRPGAAPATEADATPDPDATQAADLADLELTDEAVEGLAQEMRRGKSAEPAPPPPPFEEVPAKPLFASDAPRPGFVAPPEHVLEEAMPDDPRPAATSSGEHKRALWAFTEEEEAANRPEHAASPRNWWGIAGVLVGALILVVAMIFAFNHGNSDHRSSSPARLQSAATKSASPRVGPPLPIVSVDDFDPQSATPSENPVQARLASDHKSSTGWLTELYHGATGFDGTKDGVGLLVDLGSNREAHTINLQLGGSPTGLRVYVAQDGVDAPPTSLTGLTQVATDPHAGPDDTLMFDNPVHTRYVVVWLTRLPHVSAGFQGEIREVTVRS